MNVIKAVIKAIFMSIPLPYYGAGITLVVIVLLGSYFPVVVCTIAGTIAAGLIVLKHIKPKSDENIYASRDAMIVFQHDQLMKEKDDEFKQYRSKNPSIEDIASAVANATASAVMSEIIKEGVRQSAYNKLGNQQKHPNDRK